jgi:hypothetical protein
MGRVAFCLTGSLAFSLGLFAFASAGPAASAGRAGFGGGHVRSFAPGFDRGHRSGRFHRTWLSRAHHHHRVGEDLPLLFGAAGLGDYGYGNGYGDGPGPGYGAVPVFAVPPFLGPRGAPPSPPATYVVHAGASAPYGRVRKGHHAAPRILSGGVPSAGPGSEAIDPAGGPRIIHVTVPRGL